MSNKEYIRQLAREAAQAEVQKLFVPQMFSHPKELSSGAPDSGGQDMWMLSNIPPECALALQGLKMEAIAAGEMDGQGFISQFIENSLSVLKGINGFQVKMGENMYIASSSGIGKKMHKRPGWFGRNVSDRRWKQKAEQEGEEIEE